MPLVRRLIYAAYFRLRHPGPTRRTPHVTPLCSRRTTTIACYHSPLGDTRLASPRLSETSLSLANGFVFFFFVVTTDPPLVRPTFLWSRCYADVCLVVSPRCAVSVVSTFARQLCLRFFFFVFLFFSDDDTRFSKVSLGCTS